MMMNIRVRVFRNILIAAVGVLLVSAPARAQIAPNGGTRDTGVAPVRGTDTGWDPVNHVYLLVGSTAGNTPFPLWGVFVNAAGDAVTSPFQINVPGNAQFPRVRYSPDVNNGAGGFLVAWHGGPLPDIHTRVVAYPGVLVSGEFESSSGASFQESGPATAYSTGSHVFLTVWKTSASTVMGMIVSTTGAPGLPFQISTVGLGARDPSVAYNPVTNQFGVLYSGYGGTNGATNTLALVSTGGSVVTSNTFNGGSTGTYVTDLAFNTSTNRFVATWFQNGAGTMGAEIDGSGNVVAMGLLSTTTGTYDGLSIGYNPVSGTFLLAGMAPGNIGSYNIFGAELNSRGARTSADTQVTSAGAYGSFYPRVAANTGAASWDIAFMHQGASSDIDDQVVTTTSTGGGPAATLGSAPPPSSGSTSTGGCPGTAPFPGAVCVNGGWVPGDTSGGTTTTTTGGCPGTAPFPGAVCVNGGWVPGGTSTTTTTTTSGCPGTAPFPGAVCVNGGWVPGTTSSSTSCPGYPTPPFPGAVCVNGGWIPGTGGTSTGGTTTTTTSCPGTAPFPGAVCVNGGWVPGTTSSSTSCPGYPTPPFPGAVCVNGGWIPGTGGTSTGGTTTTTSCPGTAPFPGAVCVNGGWVPGTTSTSTSCPGYPTPAFPGAVCVNGGWVPGGTTTTSGTTTTDGTCTTPDPFTAIGGGICRNGGWVPKG